MDLEFSMHAGCSKLAKISAMLVAACFGACPSEAGPSFAVGKNLLSIFDVDLETGETSNVRETRFGLGGIGFGPDGTLYGINNVGPGAVLVTVDLDTGESRDVGDLGLDDLLGVAPASLAWNPFNSTMYGVVGSVVGNVIADKVFTVDLESGAATQLAIGGPGWFLHDLHVDAVGDVYLHAHDAYGGQSRALFLLDEQQGALRTINEFAAGDPDADLHVSVDFERATGRLIGFSEVAGSGPRLYELDPTTGRLISVANESQSTRGSEDLAIWSIPEPTSVALVTLLAGWGLAGRPRGESWRGRALYSNAESRPPELSQP